MGKLPPPVCLWINCPELAARDKEGRVRRYCDKHEVNAVRPRVNAPPPSLRELIAAGPRFECVAGAGPVPGAEANCSACLLVCWPDFATGLCLDCWRVWRFAQATTPVRSALSVPR